MIVKIFGPPGTGKTTALLDILEQVLASGVAPERVAFLTFTVAARKEATERVGKRFGFDKKRVPFFRTLHSIAFGQLGIPRASMFTHESVRAFSRLTSIDFTPREYDLDAADFDIGGGAKDGDKLLMIDHLRRHRMTTLDEAVRHSKIDIDPRIVSYFTRVYAEYKRDEGLYDFTDLLMHVKVLDVDVLIVDEAQDLSLLQWRAVDVLSKHVPTVYYAGDDDQAIFTWAGADPRAFIDRKADDVRVLGRSHRVPRKVHAVAAHIAAHIVHRQEKKWLPREEEGAVEYLPSLDGWQPTQGESTYVLYRNHFVAGRVEEKLRSLGFAYSRHDRKIVRGMQWVKSILSWERMRRGRQISGDEQKSVHAALMTDQLPDFDKPWYEALGRIAPDDAQYIRGVLARHGNPGLVGTPSIELMTIHASKGREADHVVLITDMSRRSALGLLEEGDDELRVWYVGATRARKSLTLVGTDNPLFGGHLRA